MEQETNTYKGYVIFEENSQGLWANFTKTGLTETDRLPVKIQYGRTQDISYNFQNILIMKSEPGNLKNSWAELKQNGHSTTLLLTPVW